MNKNDLINKVYLIIEENDISAKEVLDLFLFYNGNQILDEDFIEFLDEEGFYIPSEED